MFIISPSVFHKHAARRAARTRLALTGLALAALGLAPAVHAQSTITSTYTTAGAYSFLDPAGVFSPNVTLDGAGGASGFPGNSGGSGASVMGTLAVTPGTTYDILVGGGFGDSIGSLGDGGGGNRGGGGGMGRRFS